MKIKIIGDGAWGKALYSVLTHNSKDVQILGRGDKAQDLEVVVLSVPTQSIREALSDITFSGKTKILVNTSKGIEKSTHLLPSQIIHEVLGQDIEYYTLIGPSFAQEVVEKMPTLVNLGYKIMNSNNEYMKELFQTDFFRVRLTTGVDVLELSAAFKNIYAIACGLADGLGYGTNTRVNLIVLAMEEISILFHNLSLKIDSELTAGTIGDLILTSNSSESRNFTFGSYLVKHPVSTSLEKVSSTVEGYHSLSSLNYFKKKGNVQLPLASFVSAIVKLNNPEKVKTSFEDFVRST